MSMLEASRTKEDKTDIFIIIIRNKKKIREFEWIFFPPQNFIDKEETLKQFALNVSLFRIPVTKILVANFAIKVGKVS